MVLSDLHRDAGLSSYPALPEPPMWMAHARAGSFARESFQEVYMTP